jgi:N-dimethylarginine dimethylaminohydrolase
MRKVFTSADQINFRIKDISIMPVPGKVLMVEPTFFDVTYVINPHMAGHIGSVNTKRAREEWEQLADGFRSLGIKLRILEGRQGLPDMVFCANQSLPFIDEKGNRKVVMGIMHTDERKEEVPFIEEWFRGIGYEILHLDCEKVSDFEGMGDGIWHFRRRLLWGGYGFRTDLNAFTQISDILDVPVITLELVDERFYHLDTCFCPLDENSVLIYPPAFNEKGLEMIHELFEKVIEANSYEAEKILAVNAVSPDGKNVLIQEGCEDVNEKLRKHGFNVHEFRTNEFLKSGGSVFCMKLLYW